METRRPLQLKTMNDETRSNDEIIIVMIIGARIIIIANTGEYQISFL